jgi:hypothetical protein
VIGGGAHRCWQIHERARVVAEELHTELLQLSYLRVCAEDAVAALSCVEVCSQHSKGGRIVLVLLLHRFAQWIYTVVCPAKDDRG